MVKKRILASLMAVFTRIRSNHHVISEESNPFLTSMDKIRPAMGPVYILSPTVGDFVMVGFTMVEGKTRYQLKHKSTGKIFTVSKPLFELLFEHKG